MSSNKGCIQNNWVTGTQIVNILGMGSISIQINTEDPYRKDSWSEVLVKIHTISFNQNNYKETSNSLQYLAAYDVTAGTRYMHAPL